MRIVILAALLLCIAALTGYSLKTVNIANVPITIYSCVEPFCTQVPLNLTDAVLQHAAPGMVVGAINTTSGQPLFIGSVGRHTYDEVSARVTDQSRYDMASCSKVMGATTAAAVLVQRGLLGLDDFVASDKLLGPKFASQGKGEIKIRNLLLHNAGYPPDPVPSYADVTFPCPNNKLYHPGQNFECVPAILEDLLLNQKIVTPPGTNFVYSDLSMITLMFVVGKVVKDNNIVSTMVEPCFDPTNYECQYNAFLRSEIWGKLSMVNTSFVPRDAEVTPPEWYEMDYFRHSLVKGFVSDGNAYAMGGISGHAGVFTNVHDALRLMKMWMFNTNPELINPSTVKTFTTVANLTQSSRALGWDTNDQSYRWCGSMSNEAFLHIGFTGTELCGDPVTGIATAILANGRYPDFDTDKMTWYRPVFNTLIHDLYVGSKH